MVKQSRQLENHNEAYCLNEDFNTLDNWEKSGSPTGIMVLPRTEPAYRKPVDLPGGVLKTESGNLILKTGEPGYYGLHNERTITTMNFRMEFKARINKFSEAGYPLGVHVNVGAEKYDLLLRKDGIYELKEDKGPYRKIINTTINNDWHVWSVVMQLGHASIYKDGAFIGKGSVRIDGSIGHRPITISATATKASDPAEMEMEYFRYENIDIPDHAGITNSLGMEMMPIKPENFVWVTMERLIINNFLRTKFIHLTWAKVRLIPISKMVPWYLKIL
ncbi:MAG: hypothetical protein WDO16_09305 [Bacteroidota bacterium]